MARSLIAESFDEHITTLTDIDRPAIERLAASFAVRDEADSLMGTFVTWARKEGATWEAIGAACCMSKQAAQQRWG